jgi:hypothetical protein
VLGRKNNNAAASLVSAKYSMLFSTRQIISTPTHPSHTPKESLSPGIAATIQAMYRIFDRGFGFVPRKPWRGHIHGLLLGEDTPQHSGCMRTLQQAARF